MTTAEMNTNILSLTEYQRKQIAAQLQEYLQLNYHSAGMPALRAAWSVY